MHSKKCLSSQMIAQSPFQSLEGTYTQDFLLFVYLTSDKKSPPTISVES